MIPKIIHQVWEGATEPVIPERLQILSESWKEQNPDWEYRLWNQAAMEQLVECDFPDFKEVYSGFAHAVQRWDAIRYMILYKYGGFYADLDTECLKPFTGTCSPFQRKMFLNTYHNLLPCEKVSYKHSMGKVDDNVFIDTSEIVRKYNFYYEHLKEICRHCYAGRSCSICLLTLEKLEVTIQPISMAFGCH